MILVIGGQKIVPDTETGMRRIHEYAFPLEDTRARHVYGVPSGVNNVLIINRVIAPDRVTAILDPERYIVTQLGVDRGETSVSKDRGLRHHR